MSDIEQEEYYPVSDFPTDLHFTSKRFREMVAKGLGEKELMRMQHNKGEGCAHEFPYDENFHLCVPSNQMPDWFLKLDFSWDMFKQTITNDEFYNIVNCFRYWLVDELPYAFKKAIYNGKIYISHIHKLIEHDPSLVHYSLFEEIYRIILMRKWRRKQTHFPLPILGKVDEVPIITKLFSVKDKNPFRHTSAGIRVFNYAMFVYNNPRWYDIN
jgi:hypothetical protein